MNFPLLIPGRFVKRDNRFLATVHVEGEDCLAHVPNSGRLEDLFTLDRTVWLEPAQSGARKTDYDIKLVEYGDVLVSVDARLPNPLFEQALRAGRLPGWDYLTIESEIPLSDSRLDFRITGSQGVCWVETKSVTMVEENVALFPDAPTLRGQKHLRALVTALQAGHQAAVVFVVQRPDADTFSPHKHADPTFTSALRWAEDEGVQIRVYVCQVSRKKISIEAEIPVEFME